MATSASSNGADLRDPVRQRTVCGPASNRGYDVDVEGLTQALGTAGGGLAPAGHDGARTLPRRRADWFVFRDMAGRLSISCAGGAMAVVVSVLGGFEVVVDGTPVPAASWRRRHAARLVKFLALAEGHRRHREQVLEALWPELPPDAAVRQLHKAAHYARGAIGVPGAVALSSDLVSLLPSADLTVDLEAFDVAAASAESAQRRLAGAHRGDEVLADEARRLAERAAALYPGDVLPEDPYETWADAARGSRRLQYLRLLRQADRWEDLVREDPTNEEAHVRVAHRLATRGDRAGALRQLDVLAEVLRDELGTVPGDTAATLRTTVLALPAADGAETTLLRGRPPSPVPEMSSPILGRVAELQQVSALLDQSRILTIVGPGGVGKTTLAIEAAHRRSAARAAEACFVDLAKASRADEVPGLVATELGMQLAGSDPLQMLREAMRGRRMVLVLDNFEHVIEAAALVPEIAARSRELEIVCTSRARLRVTNEQVLEVQPFAVPGDAGGGFDNDAVALFAHHASASDPHFALEPHRREVAEICRLVDGLPLAIKLAAGHVRTLPPPLLRQRLRQSLRSSFGGPREAPERQRTIPATIDWSLHLLGAPERELFRRMGVFAGAARLGAIEEVCMQPGQDVLAPLSQLVDQSLIRRVDAHDLEPRFSMLELMRERACEQLQASPEHDDIKRRHARHVAGWLERIEEDRWTTLASTWISMVVSELSEVRAAHAWARHSGDLVLAARICGSLGTFWHREGHHAEARRWVDASLEHLDELDSELAARNLMSAAFLSWNLDPVRARSFWEGAVSRFRASGNDRYLSYCLGLTAGTYIGAEQSYETAVGMCSEAIALGRRVGGGPLVAQSLNVLGELARVHGDDDLACTAYTEGRDLALAAGDLAHVSVFLANLAYIADHRGQYEQSLQLGREALLTCWGLGRRMMAAWTVSEIAGPLTGLGRPELAARLVGAGTSALDILGQTRHLGDLGEHERVVAALRASLGEDAYGRFAAEGGRLTLEEAVHLALSAT
ncbi:ATP-binding protein [Nocardioides guangzhouensis]|nr:NB-ARC domain-containing protein [Nocardioides guangzhouensis]